ncbi:MAG TPA: hypothetical protein VM095_07405 [Pyrinomonadaceae bacterium]|nr:hypothetical protein [Pyrinomonadaceae bacterium]
MNKKKAILRLTIAALAVLGAAICVAAQTRTGPVKQNTREQKTTKETTKTTERAPVDDATYSYEFSKSDFHIRHIVIKHDSAGRGEISFERQGDIEPIIEPLVLSDAARTRVFALWEALRFLDSTTSYQADKDFAHLGTMRLKMTRGTRERTAEFNWTNDPNAKALAEEYRRAANQAVFVFDISVARQNQPLDSPKLLDRLDNHLKRGDLSDPQQLVPLLRELNTDERLPLMSRNHAARILKLLEK